MGCLRGTNPGFVFSNRSNGCGTVGGVVARRRQRGWLFPVTVKQLWVHHQRDGVEPVSCQARRCGVGRAGGGRGGRRCEECCEAGAGVRPVAV